jgi:hypothetical protein
MLVLRIIGAVLLLVAATVFVLDMMPALNGNNWRLSSFGESWFKLHSYSLNLTQVIVQRHISPDLWDDVLQPVLLYPTTVVLLVPGVIAWLIPGPQRSYDELS